MNQTSGFNIAFGFAGEQSLPGPGKDAFCAALPSAERAGFVTAEAYFLPRNIHAPLVPVGEAIAKATPETAAACKVGDSFFALGFDIATGLYGENRSICRTHLSN